MSQPFLAEIRIIGFNFAPRGYAFCDGQLFPINQNQSLYSLLGTTYGGDGRTTFALPDLRGRTPIHEGNDHQRGQKGGAETVTLTTAQIAAHTHTVKATSDPGDNPTPTSLVLAAFEGYVGPTASARVAIRSGTVTNTGGGQAHNNMQPYLAVNFCIVLQGLFPSRN